MSVSQEMAHTQAITMSLIYIWNKKTIQRNEGLDILDCWFMTSGCGPSPDPAYSGRFMRQAALALDFLTILVLIVAFESAFSIGGKTITPTKSSQ